MANTLRKALAIILVPTIAVLVSKLFGILLDDLALLLAGPGLHDHYYFGPEPIGYLVSSLIVGFLPALILCRVVEPIIAAVIPAVMITLHEILQLDPFRNFHAPNVAADLFYYLLSWPIAIYIGLLIWGAARTSPVR